jgi:hypothetical protein
MNKNMTCHNREGEVCETIKDFNSEKPGRAGKNDT